MKYSFIVERSSGVLVFLSNKISGVGLSAFKKLLKDGEIKVNGKRVKSDVSLCFGDKVDIFVPASFLQELKPEIVYEDENVLIVDKPEQTTVDGGLMEIFGGNYQYLAPVHRLDRNTLGLVVLAKNKESENILLNSFRKRELEKKYRALVKGVPCAETKQYTAYIFKDAEKSRSYISDIPKTGYKQIITGCSLVRSYGSVSEVELELVTGRTHQLRAHLAHLNYPIIGDNKYGDFDLNKRVEQKTQLLKACSIEFGSMKAPLTWLSNKKIELTFHFDDELINKILTNLKK